jgi:hypothetical protein
VKTTSTFKRISLGLFMIAVILFICVNVLAGTDFKPKNAKDALALCQKNHQYLFLVFCKEKSDLNRAFEPVMKDFIKKTPGKIVTYRALNSEVKESEMVMLYANDIPNPALVVFAPNGAMVNKFSEKVTTQELQKCIITDLTMKMMKVIQNRRIVLVVLQNKRTKFNKESMDAAKYFVNDSHIKPRVEIVTADPDDPANNGFLKQCSLKPQIAESTAVLVEQVGTVGGVWPGKSAKAGLKKIIDDLEASKDDDY